MSKEVVFHGQEIVNLLKGLNQGLNVARAYTVEERESSVIEKEASLRANGQISPVQLQEDNHDGYYPITGLTRIAAAARIVEGTLQTIKDEETGEEKTIGHEPDPTFQLKAIVYKLDELSEVDRAVRCVVDNQVESPSDIDLGRAVAYFTKELGLTFVECSARLGLTDPNKAPACLKLLSLPQWLQDAIHKGQVATSVGLFYHKLKGKAKSAVGEALKAAIENEKSLTLKQVQKLATAAEEEASAGGDGEGEGDGGDEDGDSEEETPVRRLPITEVEEGFTTLLADLKSQARSLQTEEAIARAEKATKVAASLDRWLHGECSYNTLLANVLKAFDVE